MVAWPLLLRRAQGEAARPRAHGGHAAAEPRAPRQRRPPCGVLPPPRADRRGLREPAPARGHAGVVRRRDREHRRLRTGLRAARRRQPRPAMVLRRGGRALHLHDKASARRPRWGSRLRWRAPACRGRPPPPRPARARWPRAGVAGAPGDAQAPPQTGAPPRRPGRRWPQPRLGAWRVAPASGKARRPCSARGPNVPRALGGARPTPRGRRLSAFRSATLPRPPAPPQASHSASAPGGPPEPGAGPRAPRGAGGCRPPHSPRAGGAPLGARRARLGSARRPGGRSPRTRAGRGRSRRGGDGRHTGQRGGALSGPQGAQDGGTRAGATPACPVLPASSPPSPAPERPPASRGPQPRPPPGREHRRGVGRETPSEDGGACPAPYAPQAPRHMGHRRHRLPGQDHDAPPGVASARPPQSGEPLHLITGPSSRAKIVWFNLTP